jgi:hypothetical protein
MKMYRGKYCGLNAAYIGRLIGRSRHKTKRMLAHLHTLCCTDAGVALYALGGF